MMAVLTMVQALNQALDQAMEKDKSVVCYGEDVGLDGGVFRVTDGLIKKHPEQVFDSPLAECGIVGTAIGMGIMGMKPVVEIQFFGFIYPAMNQLISHAARIRNRTRGSMHCPIVVRTPAHGGVKALEHHSESTEAMFVHIPGLKVVMPSTPYDAKGLMLSAIEDEDPIIFLEPTKVYRSLKEEVPEGYYTVPIGKANIIQEGNDLTIVTWGAYVKDVMDTIRDIKDVSIELIDLRTLSPMDAETVINSVKKTGRLLIVQEACRTCSISSELMARTIEKAYLNLKAPPMRLAGYDIIMPLPAGEKYYLVNDKMIKHNIKKIMEY